MSHFEFEIECPLGGTSTLAGNKHQERHEKLGWQDIYCSGMLGETELTDLLRFLLKDKLEEGEG